MRLFYGTITFALKLFLKNCSLFINIVKISPDITLGIRGGSNQTGLLYISHDSSEMQVCADTWRDYEANAACLLMGFNGGRAWSRDEMSTDISTR